MARRLAQSQSNLEFPPNTIYLDFPRSDGDASKWPSNTTCIVDSDGQVNFLQLLDPEENIYARRWRAAVGKAIATKLEMQGDHNNYVLRTWPQGYRFYDHHKGLADTPRHDLYLYGYRGGRFRSINEFVPHAIWLYSDPTMNYSNCDCKYCTKQPQKGITASMGEILGTPSVASPRIRRDKPRKPRNPKPYAAVQKVLEPVKTIKTSPHVQPGPILAERDSDLRAVFSQSTMTLKRWYRDGEIVWCELPTRIAGPSTSSSDIVYWPGIVREYKFKAKSIPTDPNQRASDSTPGIPSSTQTAGGPLDDGRGVVLDKQHPTPFKVQQSTVYLVDLLAINKPVHFPDTKVFPYQAYVPSSPLIHSLQSVPIPLLNFDRNHVAAFNPLLNDPPIQFEVATSPYAAALEIASKICGYFSVSDEWEFSYTTSIPIQARTPTVTFPTPTQNFGNGDGSIESAITLAHQANASTAPTNFGLTIDPFQNISTTQPNHSQAQLSQVAKNVLGPSPTPGKVRTQIRFQGLWWGPERIWVDDFVRLKPLRRCLAPYGAQNIFPPAGPSKSVVEMYKTKDVDPSEAGAGIRGCFLQIESLFVVETVEDGKRRRECRASGMLYELADEDWVEDDDEMFKKYKMQLETKNQGKENYVSNGVASSSTQGPSTSTQTQIQTKKQTPTTTTTTPSSQPPFNYLLPKPPIGYRFRPIITPGYEIAVSFSMIAGRYYPGLLSHPLIAHETKLALQADLTTRSHLWALEGLGGGFHCSVDPVTFVAGRFKMFELADKFSYEQLEMMKKTELANLNGVKREIGEEDVDMLFGSEDEARMIRNASAKKSAAVAGSSSSGRGYDRDGDVSMS